MSVMQRIVESSRLQADLLWGSRTEPGNRGGDPGRSSGPAIDAGSGGGAGA